MSKNPTLLPNETIKRTFRVKCNTVTLKKSKKVFQGRWYVIDQIIDSHFNPFPLCESFVCKL